MRKIYLINEFDYDMPDIQGYMTGSEDYPATDLGIMRAKLVYTDISAIPFASVYSSPLMRCKDPAQKIFDQVEISELLTDADLGLWQGLGLDDIQEKWPEEYKEWLFNPVSTPPEAESIDSRAERLRRFLDQACSKANGNIAVFTHQKVIAPFMAQISGLPEDKLHEIRLPYGSVSILEEQNGIYKVLSSGEQIIPVLDEDIIKLFLDYYDVSEEERLRCVKIAEKARSWADQLSETGLLLDSEAVYDAGRLQSIGGTDQEGAELGSRILDTMGYSDEAYAVLNHIQLFFRSIINEAVILYLSNRLFSYGDELSFNEVFDKDRAQNPDDAEPQIERDIVIIHMVNTLYGEKLIPLNELVT